MKKLFPIIFAVLALVSLIPCPSSAAFACSLCLPYL